MATVVTPEQRASKDPIMKEWVVAKDKENATPTPIPTPSTGTTATLPGPYLGAGGTSTAGKTVTVPTPSTSGIGAMAGAVAGIPSGNMPNQYGGVGNAPYGPTLPTPSATAPVTPTVNTQTTTPQPSLYQDPFARSREDIAKLAADRIAKILQAGRTSAAGARTGAKNAYDYTNQIEGDNRVLRNASMKESANPFGGSFGYQAAMNNRNDSIQDTAQDKDYNAQVGLINQKLADLEAAAPGDEQAIIDQLEQIERQTGISVADLQEKQKQNQLNQSNWQQTFNYNSGQDSIKNNQNQQVIDYNQDPNNPNNYGQTLTNQLNELKIGNYSTEVKQQAQLFEQELKSGKMSNEAAEYNLKQLKDPKSAVNMAKQYDTEIKRLELAGLPEQQRLELQQLKKQIAQIGVVHYKPQSEAEIAQDKVTLATANKQLADIANGKYPGDKNAPESISAIDYAVKYVDSVAKYDNGVLVNGPAVETQILSSGKTVDEMRQMYGRYGLKWGD